MEEDVSKNTIIVLVVLTLAVSMIGTWAVLEELSSVQPTSGDYVPEAQVQLRIVGSGDLALERPTSGSGNVALTITPT